MTQLSDLRDLVSVAIGDPNHYEVSLARLTNLINEAYRDVVRDGELNPAEIMIQVALVAGTITPTVIGPTVGGLGILSPATVTYEDWSGTDVFSIDDCLAIREVVRHISKSDGYITDLIEVNSDTIDRMGLHDPGGDRLQGYRILNDPVFKMAVYPPQLADSAYPYTLSIPYTRIPAVLVDDDDEPTVPPIYHDLIKTRAAVLCYKANRKYNEAAGENAEYQRAMQSAIDQRGSKANPAPITRRYRRRC
jgi:hypothetical protein